MGWAGALACEQVRILDADGTPLTTARTRELDGTDEVGLSDVEDAWALLDYYFGRGERLVVLDLGGVTVEGTLDTRWVSAERIWWVQVRESLVRVSQGRSARSVPEPDEAERAAWRS